MVRHRVTTGALPAIRTDRGWRVAGADLLALLAAQAAPPPAPPTDPDRIDPERAYGATEAAAVLGVTPEAVRLGIRVGRLPATREGRRWRVRGADLRAILAAGRGGRPG